MTGKNKAGGYNTSPTASYLTGMCRFIAGIIFRSWKHYLNKRAPVGGAGTPLAAGQGLQAAPKLRTQEVKGSSSTSKPTSLGLSCPWSGPLQTPPSVDCLIISEAQIEAASTELEEKWVDRPIKDELDLPVPDQLSAAAPGRSRRMRSQNYPGRRGQQKDLVGGGPDPRYARLRKA